MGRQDSEDEPGRGQVPRSPTGRVPQWVVDEARGTPVEPVPFRATPSGTHRGGRRRSSGSRAMTVLAVGALLVAGWWVRDPLGTRTQAASARRAAETGPSTGARQAPPPGREETGIRPAARPGVEGRGFRFSAHQADGTSPVGWSPCRPIHVVVRPDHAPPDGDRLLAEALAAVGTASGLRLVVDGPTREAPVEDRAAYQPDRYGDRWAPVLITWATQDEVPDFGVDIAGEAGPASVQTASGDRTYVTGTVALDPESVSRIGLTSGRAAARAVVLHELGHLVGLAHVNDAAQVMYPRAGQATAYAAGDLVGLAALGSTACQPDV